MLQYWDVIENNNISYNAAIQLVEKFKFRMNINEFAQWLAHVKEIKLPVLPKSVVCTGECVVKCLNSYFHYQTSASLTHSWIAFVSNKWINWIRVRNQVQGRNYAVYLSNAYLIISLKSMLFQNIFTDNFIKPVWMLMCLGLDTLPFLLWFGQAQVSFESPRQLTWTLTWVFHS